MKLTKSTKANLVPRWVQWQVKDNKISVRYDIFDHINQSALDSTYINFKPSKELVLLMEKEINKSIKQSKK